MRPHHTGASWGGPSSPRMPMTSPVFSLSRFICGMAFSACRGGRSLRLAPLPLRLVAWAVCLVRAAWNFPGAEPGWFWPWCIVRECL